MVWKEAIEKIRGPKRVFAVGVVAGDHNSTFTVVEAHIKKEELHIQNKYTVESLELLLEGLPKNVPIVLSFSGQKVITKENVLTENYKAKILFNADPNDFYWFELVQREKVFASIVRKEDIDVLLEQFESAGLSVLNLNIGPLGVHSLKPLLGQNPTIDLGDYVLEFTKDELKSVKKTKEQTPSKSYSFDGEELSIEYLLPFAAIVNHIYPSKDVIPGDDFLQQSREDFKFKKAFNTLGLVVMAGFLLLLSLSYVLLGYYQDKYMDLQVELGEQNVAYNKLIALENDKKNKEEILNESGLTDSNFLSFYAFQITQKIPEDITLTDLRIFPTAQRIKPKERVLFQNDLIHIGGNALSNSSFTEWIKHLKQLNWIENLEIADFTNNGNSNVFELKLTVSFDVQ